MNAAQILAAFRAARRDEVEPYLWSDDELVGYLNEAVQQACERALLIEDSTSAAASVALAPGQSVYPMHPSVLRIKRAVILGCRLCETSIEALDSGWGGWETVSGMPRHFVFQQSSPPSIRVTPVPVDNLRLDLTVYRGALTPIDRSDLSQTPEIPERFHVHLLDWMHRCALLKDDAETRSPDDAARYEASFERNFGRRADANVQRKQLDRRPPLVRINW